MHIIQKDSKLMSAYLSKLLNKTEKEVSQFISQMEERLLYPSVDVRLLAEVKQTARQKITELGLDSDDTTGEELYHALRAKFASDSRQIDRALGISKSLSFEQRLARAVNFIHHAHGDEQVWALKPTVVKSLLRSLPPKKTLTCWHYRSLESMLKREDSGKILLAGEHLEPASWQIAMARYVKKLSAANYEQRPVKYYSLNNVNGAQSNLVAVSKLAGAVAICPGPKLDNASGLHLIHLLQLGLSELGIKTGPTNIAKHHPALNWWSKVAHILSLPNGHPVSFNLNDVAANHLHATEYSQAQSSHGAATLWAELKTRYAGLGSETEEIEQQVVEKAKKLAVPTPAELAKDMVGV